MGFCSVEKEVPFFFHNQEVGFPVDWSVNWTFDKGAQPENELAVKLATGCDQITDQCMQQMNIAGIIFWLSMKSKCVIILDDEFMQKVV